MLLGNCISGVSLTVTTITTSFVEQTAEIELFLAFGASPFEASLRLLREAIRVGSLPMLNSMAVIGLISIPGMMTGQLLAGAPVVDSARYQMLIMYLIALTTFGAIFCEVWIVYKTAFNKTEQMLREDHFTLQKASIYSRIGGYILSLNAPSRASTENVAATLDPETAALSGPSKTSGEDYEAIGSKSTIKLEVLFSANSGQRTVLDIRDLSRKLSNIDEDSQSSKESVLFQDINHSVANGTIVAVRAPSGSGKSQLLRCVARLVPTSEGELILDGRLRPTRGVEWRRQVIYVSQTKIDIPGTPADFIRHIPTFRSWKLETTIRPGELLAATEEQVQQMGLESSCLEKSWKALSGGESQRIHLAIALASKPRVLLMDESTSALDAVSKRLVEEIVVKQVSETGMAVLWITHDVEQVERLRSIAM